MNFMSMKKFNTQLKNTGTLLFTALLSFSVGAQANDRALPIESTNALRPFQTPGHVSVNRYTNSANRTVMDLVHNVDKTILNWDSFDIGRLSIVNFKQLDSSSLTLNRIFQGSPSQIFGQLNANGRIFLINQNGILFGEGSQTNVQALTASSLNITDEVFDEGILSAIDSQDAAFIPFTDPVTNQELASKKITIESGAQLNAKERGSIFILAPDIQNNGIIRTPEGQTILAAGKKVYLAASQSADLRGLLVEVSSGGTATNLGQIIASRGNVTLVGLAVNQNNRVSASTTTSANGSIRLVARELDESIGGSGNFYNENTNSFSTNSTGQVTLGNNSVTQILTELNAKDTAIDDQVQFKSRVELMGKKIHLKKNSKIIAKGGEVDIAAVENPSMTTPADINSPIRNNDVVVQMDSGSKIDVSGNSTTLAMNRNNVTVELRGNELSDLPLQREGSLRGKTVVVDVRRRDEYRLGNIDGFFDGIKRNVQERTAVGGTVKINSEGGIRFLNGAEIDVSGGVVNYRKGKIQSTILNTGVRRVDIHEADPNIAYKGIYETTSRVESAYKEGKDAGSVQFAGNSLIVDGTLKGKVTVGRYQRDEASRPQGGLLTIGLSDGQGIKDFRAPNITLKDMKLGIKPDINDSFTSDELILSTDFLSKGGFTRADLNSNGNITISKGKVLTLPPNSQIKLKGKSVNINRSITSSAGDLDFAATEVNQNINIDTDPAGLFVAGRVTLDVSGNWTNDQIRIAKTSFPTSPVLLNGGSISLRSEFEDSKLSLGNSVALISLGGARIDKESKLSYGRGGDITLAAEDEDIGLDFGSNNYILGHGPGGGGTFTLGANKINVERMSAAAWLRGQKSINNGGVTRLPDFFFSDTGFSDFKISSNQGDLIVKNKATINLKNAQLFLPSDARLKKSTTLSSLLRSGNSNSLLLNRNAKLGSGWLNNVNRVVPWLTSTLYTGHATDYMREPGSLTLETKNDIDDSLNLRTTLLLSNNAAINADADSVLSFINKSGGVIDIQGSIYAPGSDIDFSLSRPANQNFSATSAIAINSSAKIDASATFIEFPDLSLQNRFRNQSSLKLATAYDAGEITISSSGFIIVDKGAVVDVTGTSERLDVSGGLDKRVVVRNKTVNAQAGAITFQSGEGIVNDGSMKLSAINKRGAYGGSLSYELDSQLRGEVAEGITSFSDIVPEIILSQTRPKDVNGFAIYDSAAYKPGDVVDTAHAGKLELFAKEIKSTGTDQLLLKTASGQPSGKVEFKGNVSLSLRRDIVLDSSVISADGGESTLSANYVAIGASGTGSGSDTPSADTNKLTINANLIELVGLTNVKSIDTVNLNSKGDIRFRGVGNQIRGEFAIAGDLTLKADKIYPTTLSEFLIDAGATGSIDISPSNNKTGLVLSAGGDLTLHAGTIRQHGVIRAPSGRIDLQADNKLTLGKGSVTSVSNKGQSILLGQNFNGLEWKYVTNSLVNARDIYTKDGQDLPEKKINLDSDDIDVVAGAVVDLSGGGQLVNWEFVPGPGGSLDFLLAENADNFFAVLPGVNSFAPFDAQEFAGWDFAAAESVYLSGVKDLKFSRGSYVKLPARYALLPGAFLVEKVDGFDNLPLDQQGDYLNGTLVAGFERISGTTIQDSNTSGYLIRDGDYANQLSEFNLRTADKTVVDIAKANDFSLPRLNQDAGSLAVEGKTNIDLDGTFLTAAAAGGRGALVDISANELSVVNSKTTSTGTVELLASSLNKLSAESLYIGGKRTFTDKGTEIAVNANKLEVKENVALTGSEIILAAKDELDIRRGSTLTGSGKIADENEDLYLDGDSALVRVSAASQVGVIRTTNTTGSAELSIEAGALIKSDESITLDSSGDFKFDSDINIATGGSLHLGAGKINVGDVSALSSAPSGLIIDDSKLERIADIDLVLRSGSTIDFYGAPGLNQNNLNIIASGLVADQSVPDSVKDKQTIFLEARGLDKATINNDVLGKTSEEQTQALVALNIASHITLQTNESFEQFIEAYQSLDDIIINADRLTLGNGLNAVVPGAVVNADKQLVINSNELNLSEGEFKIEGFSLVDANIIGNTTAIGDVSLSINGELQLETSRITATSGSDIGISVDGDIALTQSSITAASSAIRLGAKLDISGDSILLDTMIDMPVGRVNLTATDVDGDVVLGQNADIDVSGFSVDVLGIDEINLPGGNVTLLSKQGDVELKQGSRIDVSSGGTGSAAGSIELLAEQGDVSVQSDLVGRYPDNIDGSQAVELGGSILVDAMTIGQATASAHTFRELNTRLNAGAFTNQRFFRQRTGDFLVDLNYEAMLAQNIKLIAEDGDLEVKNANLWTVDQEQGGKIELIAADNLIIGQGAWLSVAPLANNSATGTQQRQGGDIVLEAVNGMIDLRGGSILQLGSIEHDGTEAGSLHLRVQRTDTDNNGQDDSVNINSFSSFLLGGNDVIVEAVKHYDTGVGGVIDETLINTIKTDTDTFMNNNVAVIKAGLSFIYRDPVSGDVKFDGSVRLQPGVEISHVGDLTLNDTWDFSDWRYDGEPGELTIRATGNISVNENITDGVKTDKVPKIVCRPFFGCSASTTEFDELVSILSDRSWGYTLTAGASQVNSQFSVDRSQFSRTATSDMVLAAEKLIRTGTGDITINTAGNVELADSKSAIYTLGRLTNLNLDRREMVGADEAPKFVSVDSGDVSINAGNDIIGPAGDTQLINEWFRRNKEVPLLSGGGVVEGEDAGTWLDYANFQQGIASFGGGDVNIYATNNITRLSVSAPTYVKSDLETKEVSRHGKGNIFVEAGGDIEGGIFFIGDGVASINAGGNIVGARNGGSSTDPILMDAVFAQMGGDFVVNASGNIDIAAVYNPTLILNDISETSSPRIEPIFNTYAETSLASFTSFSGGITLTPGDSGIKENILNSASNGSAFNILPGSLRLAAVDSNVNVGAGALSLSPSSQGGLEIYGGDSVLLQPTSTFLLSDAAVSSLPDVNNFFTNLSDLNPIFRSTVHAGVPVHQGDNDPSWVVAREGDIQNGIFNLNEQSRFYAGRDISDIRLFGQNVSSRDITRIQAGRDFKFDINNDNNRVLLSGPGRLELIAGRNIDLGESIRGIETAGNLSNPALAEQGADIIIQAGVGAGPQYQAFYAEYFGVNSTYRQTLVSFLKQKYGTAGTNDFLSKSVALQWREIGEEFIPILLESYYSELRLAGDELALTKSAARGYKAIDVLFPESKFNRVEAYSELSLKLAGESDDAYFERLAGLSDYTGNLSMFSSRIYSLDGGDISLLVPGGFVNAGLAADSGTVDENAPEKPPLGVVAQSFGGISSYTRGDFLVNQSRVSTLLGGDILMWSSVGDIDAGRGSKASISAPEPQIRVSPSGEILVDLSNTLSGQGIRSLSVDPSIDPGDITLIAPNGFINAGDAGIAGGEISLIAPLIVNSENIAGNIVVGAPTSGPTTVSTSNLSGVTNVASAASKVAEDAAQNETTNDAAEEEVEETQLSLITVEVLGFGDNEEA